MIPIRHPVEGTDGDAGLSIGDAAAAHEATSGGLPPRDTPLTLAVVGNCRTCGAPIATCPGVHQLKIDCAGFVHQRDGRHGGFIAGEMHLAAPGGPALRLGRGPARASIVRGPELRAVSHAGRDQLDRWDTSIKELWQVGRWALAGILFVALMVWANWAGIMR